MAKKFLETTDDRNVILARGTEVVRIEAQALELLAQNLGDEFVDACHAIVRTRRNVVVTGMGKSGHIARKIASTLAATGTPAMFLHPAEAAHGDLGVLAKDDTLIVISNSGSTSELRPVLHYARQCNITIIGMASRHDSMVAKQSDIQLIYPATREACAANIAPTTSTTLQLALGDALALAVMDQRGFSRANLHSLHPGGAIGLQLTPICEIMHGTERLPLVHEGEAMADAIFAMTSGGFGIAGVIDEAGDLLGVITDGDLRRHFAKLSTAFARDIMTRSPKTLTADILAQDALLFLNEAKITAAFVLDRLDNTHPQRPVGIVHIHDFLRFGLN